MKGCGPTRRNRIESNRIESNLPTTLRRGLGRLRSVDKSGYGFAICKNRIFVPFSVGVVLLVCYDADPRGFNDTFNFFERISLFAKLSVKV